MSRRAKSDVRVMSAAQLPSDLRSERPTLAAEDAAIIAALLDDKCRDVVF